MLYGAGILMTEGEIDTSQRSDVPVHNRPAVGIRISPQTSSDAVAGSILRAHRQGHQVFVAHERPTNDEAVEFASQLDATVVDLGTTLSNDDAPLFKLTQDARRAGFPGVIWQEDPAQRVDFERSTAAFVKRSDYVIEAREEPVVTPDPEVLVAIPAYNEGRTIAEIVSQAQPYADEVLVIDDGSDDTTGARASGAGATVIEHETNQGYGAALATAFFEADRSGAAQLVVIDGDGQHDPADIPRLIETQREREADIVIGSRFAEDGGTNVPFYRHVGLAVVNVLTNVSLGVLRPGSRVRDTQSGFRAYDEVAIRSLATADDVGDDMGASTDILHHAHRNDYDIVEVGTTVDYDVEDGSSKGPFNHGFTLVFNLLRTVERERPVMSLGIPGFLSTMVGIGFGYWTFHNFIATGVFPVGLAVISTFFALAGIFSAFTAIILHSLNQHNDS